MTIEQQPNAPAPERVERHVNADSLAARDDVELGAYRRLRAVVGFTDEQAQALARAGHDVVAVYDLDQLIAGVR